MLPMRSDRVDEHNKSLLQLSLHKQGFVAFIYSATPHGQHVIFVYIYMWGHTRESL